MTEKCRTVLRMCIVFFRCRYGASELHSVAAFIGGETRHRWPRSHVPNVPWVPETFHARFPVSVKSSNQVKSSGFAARVFGRRPKTCQPAADEAPRHTREKISGSQGISNVNSVPKNAFEGIEKKQSAKKCLLKQCLFENSYPCLRPTVGLVGKSAELYGTFYI